MGENNNFSTADVVVKEKLSPVAKEPALANLNFLSVSSGFYFMVFTLISLLITIIIGIISYFSIIETVESSELMFKKYAIDTLTMSSDSIQNAVELSLFNNYIGTSDQLQCNDDVINYVAKHTPSCCSL